MYQQLESHDVALESLSAKGFEWTDFVKAKLDGLRSAPVREASADEDFKRYHDGVLAVTESVARVALERGSIVNRETARRLHDEFDHLVNADNLFFAGCHYGYRQTLSSALFRQTSYLCKPTNDPKEQRQALDAICGLIEIATQRSIDLDLTRSR